MNSQSPEKTLTEVMIEKELEDQSAEIIEEQEKIKGLYKNDREILKTAFEKPVASDSVFIITNMLMQSNPQEINSIMELFGEHLRGLAESKELKSPETLASLGIYLSLILRFNPELELYLENEHFLMLGLKVYYPYLTMFITYFLVPAVLRGANINDYYLKEPVRLLDQIRRMSPKNANKFHPKNTETDEDRLRGRVGASMVASINDNLSSDSSTRVCLVDKMTDLCPLNSPERRLFSEFRRLTGSNPSYLISRLGLKSKKQELAIFLDDPELLEEELSEDDIQKAIFLHANKILSKEHHRSMGDGHELFKPHHFDRAVKTLNYDIAKLTFELSDWISNDTLDEILYQASEMKHALCLEILKLVVQKNITLCHHKLKKIPLDWKELLLGIYTKPRWTALEASSSDESALVHHYRTYLCSTAPKPKLIASLKLLEESLGDEEKMKEFLANLHAVNKSYYLLETSTYADLSSPNKVYFANNEDSLLNDVFELSRNFVFPCREGDRIFLFDYNAVRTLIEKKQNIYNRNPLTAEIMDKIIDTYQQYNRMGLADNSVPMGEFLTEVVKGRQLLTDCGCSNHKNYRKKLTRMLSRYGVKDESLDVINLSDILFKLSLISIDLQATTIVELCQKLCKAIRFADPSCKESLKRTIASLIMLYSRGLGEFIIGF